MTIPPPSAPAQPALRPARTAFSSGPCAKRPGWHIGRLEAALVGRSHRSAAGKARLRDVLTRTHALLQLPDDYLIGLVPGSDTGAFEMAMWHVLGARGVDVLGWESFGKGWITDIVKQLKPDDVRVMEADYGHLPDLSAVDAERDIVFTWNGTTSGVCVPHGDWIADDRAGLVLCDATSAVFAMALPWEKLDMVTFSWQKVLGGEAAHGMLILSPRAVARLESYVPPRPLPKIFRLTKQGRLNVGIFQGETINTPSMLAVEDYLDALQWAEDIGGLAALLQRSQANLQVLAEWVAATEWVDFLCADKENLSCTSICLKITDARFAALPPAGQADFAASMVKLLADEGIAYDIGAYRDAPPGLRIWGGATVERDDLEKLTKWLDWAFAMALAEGVAKGKE